jgi:hypothetical protein
MLSETSAQSTSSHPSRIQDSLGSAWSRNKRRIHVRLAINFIINSLIAQERLRKTPNT